MHMMAFEYSDIVYYLLPSVTRNVLEISLSRSTLRHPTGIKTTILTLDQMCETPDLLDASGNSA